MSAKEGDVFSNGRKECVLKFAQEDDSYGQRKGELYAYRMDGRPFAPVGYVLNPVKHFKLVRREEP